MLAFPCTCVSFSGRAARPSTSVTSSSPPRPSPKCPSLPLWPTLPSSAANSSGGFLTGASFLPSGEDVAGLTSVEYNVTVGEAWGGTGGGTGAGSFEEEELTTTWPDNRWMEKTRRESRRSCAITAGSRTTQRLTLFNAPPLWSLPFSSN